MTLAEQTALALRLLGRRVRTPHGPGICVNADHGRPASVLSLQVVLACGRVVNLGASDVCPVT